MLVFEGHVVWWRGEVGRARRHTEEGTISPSTSRRVGKGVIHELKCCLPRSEVPLSAVLFRCVSPSDWVRDGFCPSRCKVEPETPHS